jgi:hypothetical protein
LRVILLITLPGTTLNTLNYEAVNVQVYPEPSPFLYKNNAIAGLFIEIVGMALDGIAQP